jgi:hypothetical protein
MTKTTGHVLPFQQKALADPIVQLHLLRLADGAYAKAERSRWSWHRVRRTKTPEAAARLRRRMLGHQAIAYHLDTACRGYHEPG